MWKRRTNSPGIFFSQIFVVSNSHNSSAGQGSALALEPHLEVDEDSQGGDDDHSSIPASPTTSASLNSPTSPTSVSMTSDARFHISHDNLNRFCDSSSVARGALCFDDLRPSSQCGRAKRSSYEKDGLSTSWVCRWVMSLICAKCARSKL